MQLTDLSANSANLLKTRNESVVVSESSTGGLISASLLAVAGASAYFEGGVVVYTLNSRRLYLGLRREDVQDLEPLSEPMAAKFATVAREQMNTTWAISELGAAGPTGARYGHPAGTCVLAIEGPVQMSTTVQTGRDDREANMWAFTRAAFTLFEQALLQANT